MRKPHGESTSNLSTASPSYMPSPDPGASETESQWTPLCSPSSDIYPPLPLQEPVKKTFSEQDFILLRCKNHLEFKYPNRNVWNVLNNLFLPLRPRLFLYDIQPMDLHASWSCSHFTSTNQVDLNFLISLQIFQSSWTRPNVHFMVPLFHYPSLCLASGPPTCNNLSSNLSLKS